MFRELDEAHRRLPGLEQALDASQVEAATERKAAALHASATTAVLAAFTAERAVTSSLTRALDDLEDTHFRETLVTVTVSGLAGALAACLLTIFLMK